MQLIHRPQLVLTRMREGTHETQSAMRTPQSLHQAYLDKCPVHKLSYSSRAENYDKKRTAGVKREENIDPFLQSCPAAGGHLTWSEAC